MKKKEGPKQKPVFVHFYSECEKVKDFTAEFQTKIDEVLNPYLSKGWRIVNPELNTSACVGGGHRCGTKSNVGPRVHFSALFILEKEETK